MIEPEKLFELNGGQKRRKLALTFGALERDIAGIAEKGTEYSFKNMSRADYTKKITEVLLKDPKLPPEAKSELTTLLEAKPFNELRLCNTARNHLLKIIGTFPAEWDLVIAPHSPSTDEKGIVKKRNFFPGIKIYAEDTAEGMGAEKIYISPFCVSPEQPRAVRSAMGCIEAMDWERIPLERLSEDEPIFSLETGGIPIEEFDFPQKGICIIGSEELGISPEALKKASYGRVTIPMVGLKASLNVGVAFGILMQKWTEALKKI